MNIKAVKKSIAQARKKIAMDKLKKEGVCVFVDAFGKLRALGKVYLKSGQDLTAEEEERYSRIGALCEDAGVEFDLQVFIDDLGDEDGLIK